MNEFFILKSYDNTQTNFHLVQNSSSGPQSHSQYNKEILKKTNNGNDTFSSFSIESKELDCRGPDGS